MSKTTTLRIAEMDTTQIDRRAEAWDLGLQGSYVAALEILDKLLEESPSDVVTIRMKGNLLEMKAMDLLENSSRKLISSADFLAARRCYENILEIDSQNLTARIDLGDHYGALRANDKALEYYSEAIRILQQTTIEDSEKASVQELLERLTSLANHSRLASEAKRLTAWCRQTLGIIE